MKRLFTLIGCVALTLPLIAAADFGRDTVSSEWFREWYQWGELQHFLDNNCAVSVYLTETTGEWTTSEPLMFSINGNSYRWNRYYLNHFRVDSRIESGDALYRPDMFAHSMAIDYNRGAVYWTTDSVRPWHVRLSGQGGNVGGYSISAKWLQELQEGNSAIKRLANDMPLQYRKHIVGAGNADVVYGIPVKGRYYTQHVYAAYGMRRQLLYTYDGISGAYDADYYHVQLDGQLPVAPNTAFDALHYIIRAGYRADAYSEFGYNGNETARQINHSFSVYGTKDFARDGNLTTGLTYALRRDNHREPEFSRNIIDVDGDAFEPWYADGHTHELNWALDYRYHILPWLQVHVDGYNSFMAFTSLQGSWTNSVYVQGYNMPSPLPLYDYQWHSEDFCSGMLENTMSVEADYEVLPWLRLSGSVAATLDGMLLRGKSIVTPSWEAKADIHIEPVKWFKMDLIAANYRIPYTYEQLRFLSDDYMSGQVCYAGTNTLLTTTGGQYHRLGKGLWQPQYVAVDVPIVFTIGRHEISILSSFKKYYNTWSVRLADESANSFEAVEQTQVFAGQSCTVYRMLPQERYYEIVPAPKTGSGIWDSPVFASNLIQYTYNGRKVFVSFSWQSYCVSGVSAMGNNMQTEDIQVLSESLANPNNTLVHTNMQQTDEGVRSLGRLHQDRAYIARFQLGVNITENWQLSVSGKFRDGVPFRHYATYIDTDGANRSQAVLWSMYTRGINVADGNFGQRTDSFFNFDLRLKYRGAIRGVPFAVQAVCYNIWDFGTELNEYCMYYDGATRSGLADNRTPLSLCIPRGLLLTMQVGLTRD
ncbi:MAG: hypothetical protein II540_01390 [Paludibacteraceae bacterium]|nr:hypothetical protein [Paludibacteraceae bacterium]